MGQALALRDTSRFLNVLADDAIAALYSVAQRAGLKAGATKPDGRVVLDESGDA